MKGKEQEQEQMVRIRRGIHFSPFCYPESVATKRVKKMGSWMDRRTKFELVPVVGYDKDTVWKDNHPVFDLPMADQLGVFKRLEDTWQT